MKDLFEAIVTFLIVGAFAVAGIVLTAFGSVIALMIAVLFSPKKNLDAGGRKR